MDERAFLEFLRNSQKIRTTQFKETIDASKNNETPLTRVLVHNKICNEETLQQWIQEFSRKAQEKKTPPEFLIANNSTILQKNSYEKSGETSPESNLLDEIEKEISSEFTNPISFQTTIIKETPATPIIEPKEKKFFGKYEILEKLAQGGMGIVFKVRHKELEQVYALKVIMEDKATPEMISRFNREAKTTAKLKHPNIIQVIDFGIEEGQQYFCMEYIEGKTLEQLIQEKFDLRETLIIIEKTLLALHYAHCQGVIHRDLKPSNIFVDQEGNPKIGDFGLAKDISLNHKNQKLTKAGEIMGTPAYMSPEQVLQGGEEMNELSDVYSMGACLYQIIANRCPFEGENLNDLFFQILNDEVIPPAKVNPDIHRDLDTIVLKALQKDKKKRYPTAQEFAEDIGRFLKGFPILAKPIGRKERLIRWLKRNRTSIVVATFIAFLCFSFFSYKQWRVYQKTQQKFIAREKQFKSYLSRFQLEKDLAHAVKATNKKSRANKIKHLLNALNEINLALVMKPSTLEIEQEKLALGKELILLACQNQEFALAEYIARDLKGLSFISSQEKEKFQKQVETSKNEQLARHQKRLRFWIRQLKQTNLKEGMRENAIFEISKMPEEEIFQELLKLLEKGKKYFLAGKARNSREDDFYCIMVLALGRIENPKAIGPLLKTLDSMCQKCAPLAEKPIAEIEFMVSLVSALGYLEANETVKKIAKIRWSMEQNGLFWNRTQNVYRKLLEQANLEETDAKAAIDFFERGLLKQEKEDFAGAIKDYNQALLLDGKLSNAYFNRASLKIKTGNFKGAILDLKQVLLQHPNDVAALNSLGIAKYQMGNLSEALLYFKQAIELDPKFTTTHYQRGLIYLEKGFLEKAIEDLTQVIQLSPQNAAAYNYRGVAKHRKGDWPSAIEDFNQALSLNPQDPYIYVNRGLAKQFLQDLNEALKDMNKAIHLFPGFTEAYLNRGTIKVMKKDFQGAILDFSQTIQIDPKKFEGYLNRGVAYFHIRNFSQALFDLNQAILLNPKHAQSYYNRGRVLFHQKRLLAAIENYTEAISLETQHYNAYLHRGFARFQQKDLKGAIEDFTQTIQLAPEFVEAYKHRAFARKSLKQYKKALTDYDKAIELDPQDFRAFLSRAILHQSMNSIGKAITDYSAAIALNPNYEEAYNNRGHLKLNQNDLTGAIQDFSQAITLNPKFAYAYNNRGFARYKLGQLKEALKDCNESLRLNPKNIYAYNNRGLILQAQNKVVAAIENFNHAIKLNPRDPQAYYNRGMVKFHLGKETEAKQDFSAFLNRISTKNPSTQKKQQEIYQLYPQLKNN